MSIRLAVARHDEHDRTEVERSFRAEDAGLAPEHRVAVEIADALMSMPGQLAAELVERARAVFTDRQLLELSLKVMKFNVQKVMVALGTDEPLDRESLAARSWNADGTYVAALEP
jgi:alkylhydroperoxidase family enzyme